MASPSPLDGPWPLLDPGRLHWSRSRCGPRVGRRRPRLLRTSSPPSRAASGTVGTPPLSSAMRPTRPCRRSPGRARTPAPSWAGCAAPAGCPSGASGRSRTAARRRWCARHAGRAAGSSGAAPSGCTTPGTGRWTLRGSASWWASTPRTPSRTALRLKTLLGSLERTRRAKRIVVVLDAGFGNVAQDGLDWSQAGRWRSPARSRTSRATGRSCGPPPRAPSRRRPSTRQAACSRGRCWAPCWTGPTAS